MRRFFALPFVICLGAAPGDATMTQDDEVIITGERRMSMVEPYRVAEAGDVCPETLGTHRLVVTGWRLAGDLRVRLHNLGNEPVFVYLERKDGAYRAEYPGVHVFVRRAGSDAWWTPVMSPGSFLTEGLERVSIRPGRSRAFSTSVSSHLPPDARIVKLQLRFHTRRDGRIPDVCISSALFVLPPTHR